MATRTRVNGWTCGALAAVVLSLGASAAAQPLVDEAGVVRESAYDHLRRALSGEDEVYANIDGRRLKRWLEEIVAYSRRSRDDGNRYWGRISGTEYEVMAADWTERHFRRLGMTDIHRVEFDLGPQWFPLDWSLTAAAAGKKLDFPSANPGMGSASLPGGLEAEAVWVGLGTAADFAGRDVAGKAVIIQTVLAPGQMGNSASWEGATKRAQDLGRRSSSASGATAATSRCGRAPMPSRWCATRTAPRATSTSGSPPRRSSWGSRTAAGCATSWRRASR